MAVNALPDRTPIDIADTTDPDHRDVLVRTWITAQSSASKEIEEGVYDFSIYSNGDQRGRLLTLNNREVQPDTSILWVFAAQHRPDNSWAQVTLTLKTDTQASFGSPSFVGQLLFSRYVLPFEMVSLLLLAAMIGALVLTHDMVKAQKRQVVRRLANPTPIELPVIESRGERKDRMGAPEVAIELFVLLSAILFILGALGVLVRRNAILVFMSVELMLNAANLALAAFARQWENGDGNLVVFFVMTVAAAEVAVGLALIVAIFRTKKSINIDDLHMFKD